MEGNGLRAIREISHIGPCKIKDSPRASATASHLKFRNVQVPRRISMKFACGSRNPTRFLMDTIMILASEFRIPCEGTKELLSVEFS